MKKLKYVIIIFLFFSLINIFSNKAINISISPPFIINETPESIFFNKHFTFELLFNYDEEENYKFEILSSENMENENYYIDHNKKLTISNKSDYLLYSSVYTTNEFVFFKIQIINPYNDLIYYSKLVQIKKGYSIHDSLLESTDNIIKILKEIKLENPEGKLLFDNKVKKVEDQKFKNKLFYYNEFFIANGFVKNHANIMSYLEVILGYNYTPFEFFNIETALFFGRGNIDKELLFDNISNQTFFIGTYGGFNFFLKGIVEPSVGIRFDFSYIIGDFIQFSFPISFGIKFYINESNSLKISSSFQFLIYEFDKLSWNNNYIIGIMVGYAKKI